MSSFGIQWSSLCHIGKTKVKQKNIYNKSELKENKNTKKYILGKPNQLKTNHIRNMHNVTQQQLIK